MNIKISEIIESIVTLDVSKNDAALILNYFGGAKTSEILKSHLANELLRCEVNSGELLSTLNYIKELLKNPRIDTGI